ncbi:MAG: sulfotransferase [Planctomycetes bacterium]|nr:sulfotransferase [Planctomycetota bacterium]
MLDKTLVICAGLQSGGTTLVSYCFLQRGDTDGVLDADNDLLPALDPQLARPIAWYKTTICCFRLAEIAKHYRDAGWNVRPLLVLRDLRAVWASLTQKEYGRNGITAEDPPLRLRVRRFVDDWRSIVATSGAMLRYEDFVAAPAATLQRACNQLGLPWDAAMITWPKPAKQFAHRGNGNESFWASRGEGLMETLARYKPRSTPRLPAADLDWLEAEFRDFNQANGYPPHLADACESTSALAPPIAVPSFEVTRRYIWETSRKPFRWILAQLGRRNTKLIDRRSWKRAA